MTKGKGKSKKRFSKRKETVVDGRDKRQEHEARARRLQGGLPEPRKRG